LHHLATADLQRIEDPGRESEFARDQHGADCDNEKAGPGDREKKGADGEQEESGDDPEHATNATLLRLSLFVVLLLEA
jgi:hypothetical protein